MNKKTVWLWVVLLISTLFIGSWWLVRNNRGTRMPEDANPKTEQHIMRVGTKTILVEVRDTEEERALGLSYRTELGADEGMLFIFPSANIHGFWMMEMHFNLDLIWIRDGVVVDITKNVPSPENNDGQVITVQPKEPVNWVLEVPAGWVDHNGLAVTDIAELID